MKLIPIFLLLLATASCRQSIPKANVATKNERYTIVLSTKIANPEKDPATGELLTTQVPGKIDTSTVKKLSEPLKALAAFYSAMGGTSCDGESCALTTALGLGKQGSAPHKRLIKSYFRNDKVAETVLAQDCYLRPSGASTFSDFEFLTITDKRDTVFVNYKLMHYNHGDVQWTNGPDSYVFKDHQFKKIKRNLWAFADK